MLFKPRLEYAYGFHKSSLKICFKYAYLSKNIQKSKFHDLTYAWGDWVDKGYQNEEKFYTCTYYIAKITNLGQHLGLGQLTNFHS